MNVVDVVIVVFAVALAAVGWERGLIASALPLAGFVGGAALGARVGPALLDGGSESRYAPLVSVVLGILVGAFIAIALEGLGRALRARIASGPARVADGMAGALLLMALALAIAWSFGAVALHSTGANSRGLREAVQRSAILSGLNERLPPSGPILNVLRRVDPREPVRGPQADVAAPSGGIVDAPGVRSAADSTVRVLGTACGLGVAGSGWVVGQDLVVTNAHVIAGEDDTTVAADGGEDLDAQAVHYDPRNDLAILQAEGLGLAPLEFAASTRKGTGAAVIGFPENGPLTRTPARLGRTGRVTSQDSYGRGPVERAMTPFRADVRSGNSGGPVVDSSGDVLTTVFAASTGAGPPSGLGVPNRIVERALARRLAPVDTGPCAA